MSEIEETEETEEIEPLPPVRERHAETTITELVWSPWQFSFTMRKTQEGARDE